MRVKTTENDNSTSAIAFVRKHRDAILTVAAIYCRPGSYGFNALVCDLSTYLWQEYVDNPPDNVIASESGWAFTLLYRKAHTLIRDEYRYHQQLAYGVDLSNVADHDDSDHLVDRMYYLIQQLDTDEQMLITEYLKHGNMLKVAKSMGLNYLKVTRRMSYIKEKLVRLDHALGDDFDIQALDADGTLYDDPT